MQRHRTPAGLAALAFIVCSAGIARAEEFLLEVRADEPGGTISRYLYGHFAEHLGHGIYEGIWVGEDSEIPNTRGFRNDVVEALKKLHVPVIRWPGGCFADGYDWRDGIGARAERPVRINKYWGWVEETNAFGTHEYFELLEILGADAYIAGNIGSGSPRDMADWLEYITESRDSSLTRERRANGRDEPWKVAFFGVGNETWGCGGSMTPEYYLETYKRYATFLKAPEGYRPKVVASGGWDARTDWTEVLTAGYANSINMFYGMDGISHHYYTFPSGVFQGKGAATGFPEPEWYSTLAYALRVDGYITANTAVLEKNDPEGKIGLYLDEWGTWYDPEPGREAGFLWQQNTIRDALVAALHFNIFHRHTKRLHMANIAQTVNVLQAMALTDGGRMILTPTYHAFDMYVPFQDATVVPTEFEEMAELESGELSVPHVSASAALAKDGRLVLALVNLHAEDAADVTADIEGYDASEASARVLTGTEIDAHNTFEQPDTVLPAPLRVRLQGDRVRITLPPRSVSVIALER
jgi:alpha-N-arabinofuranosidase